MDINTIWQAYLFGWAFWTLLSVGCLGLLLLHHATRGKWSLTVLRVFEGGAKILPLLFVLFLPIVINVWAEGHLYHWAYDHTDPLIQKKAAFLNPTAFTIVWLVVFGIWIGLTNLMVNSAARQDKSGDENEAQLRGNWGAFGLVLYVLSLTAGYTHWIMSLDPHWYSTIFPAWCMVGGALGGLALAILHATSRAKQEPWKTAVDKTFLKDIGNLTLAFTLLWAYFSLSQFLIMWYGNLPEEITYYHNRFEDKVLNMMGGIILLGQWLIPFIALLAPRTKQNPPLLFKVACLILLMRFLDTFWTVIPFFKEPGQPLAPMTVVLNLVAAAVFGAVWLTLYNGYVKSHSPLPTHDPRLEEAISHAQA